MRVDDFTEARIAQYPSGTGSASSAVTPLQSMLIGLNGIWTNTTAAEFAIDSSDRDMLRMAVRPWRGAGGPKTMRAYSGTAAGQGKNRTASRYEPRPLTIPLVENTRNKAEKNKLLGLVWPSTTVVGVVEYPRLLVAGFERDPQTNSRYLLDISDEGSFEKTDRGIEADAQSPLKIKSTWPWYVVPRTATSGTAFTPGGEGPDIIWGVRWANSTISDNITVTIAGAGRTIVVTYPAAEFGTSVTNPFFCFSPPFREIAEGALTTTRVPPYLSAGQTYTISVTPGGGSVFYFENYGGI